MPVFLHGLSLKNFRGIGSEAQNLGPFRDFNFFIGANNAGKSTVLDFICRYLPVTKTPAAQPLRSSDVNLGATPQMVTAAVAKPSAEVYNDAFELMPSSYKAACGLILEALSKNGLVWFEYSVGSGGNMRVVSSLDTSQWLKIVDADKWLRIRNQFSNTIGGSFHSDVIKETLLYIARKQQWHMARRAFVPAKRQLSMTEDEFADLSGRGLIKRLAELQNPDYDKPQERETFSKINRFLQVVTGKETAQIEIPHNRTDVLVHMDKKILPLASLGTGIHELVLIAAFCTFTENQILCLEEPEIHLHPLMQRKLIEYLKENTSNQYFIATHSASLIDSPNAAVFHVKNNSGQTRISHALTVGSKFQICLDLGYKASDLLQSNAIIWVEGPSDRIYLRHWLNAVDEHLIEGIHYSIMFYGGRLLSHLSASDDAVTEFINLRSINQHLAIILDSDRKTSRTRINETKKRVIGEFSQGASVAWLTKGREIENYIEHEALQAAVKLIHSGTYGCPNRGGQFDHALSYKHLRTRAIIKDGINKVAVAKRVTEAPANLGVLDLRAQLLRIVAMIRTANVL